MITATSTSTGLYLMSAEKLEKRTINLPPVEDDEVQIAPRSTTICGSDQHYFAHGRNGSITIKEPLCLGHEFAGVVTEVGANVIDMQPGDKVAVECGVPCSHCDLCLSGRYNLCASLRFRGSGSAFPHFQGSLQEKIIHPRQWVHKLPQNFTFDDGALLEPLAVAVHAVRRSELSSDQTCLIIGAGAVGLLCAAVAISRGCSRVVMADIDGDRINLALQNQFAHFGYVVKPQKAGDVEEQMSNARRMAQEICSLPPADGSPVGRFPVVFECTGVSSCVQSSIFAAGSGGRVMLVGMGTPNHNLPLSEAGAREIDLMPIWRYSNCYGEAIQLMSQAVQGTFQPDIRKLITHHIDSLDGVPEAFALARRPRDSDGRLVVKVVVRS